VHARRDSPRSSCGTLIGYTSTRLQIGRRVGPPDVDSNPRAGASGVELACCWRQQESAGHKTGFEPLRTATKSPGHCCQPARETRVKSPNRPPADFANLMPVELLAATTPKTAGAGVSRSGRAGDDAADPIPDSWFLQFGGDALPHRAASRCPSRPPSPRHSLQRPEAPPAPPNTDLDVLDHGCSHSD